MSCSLCGKFGEAAGYCQRSSCPRTGHYSSTSYYAPSLPSRSSKKSSSGSKSGASEPGASIVFLVGAGIVYNYRYEILYAIAALACTAATYWGLKSIYKKAGLEKPRTQALKTIASVGVVTAGLMSVHNHVESSYAEILAQNVEAAIIAREQQRLQVQTEREASINAYLNGPQFFIIQRDNKMNNEENQNNGYLIEQGSCLSVSRSVNQNMFIRGGRPLEATDGNLTVEGYIWHGILTPAPPEMIAANCQATIATYN